MWWKEICKFVDEYNQSRFNDKSSNAFGIKSATDLLISYIVCDRWGSDGKAGEDGIEF